MIYLILKEQRYVYDDDSFNKNKKNELYKISLFIY